MAKQFGRNFTKRFAKHWEEHIRPLDLPSPLRFLELGVYQARTSCWMLDNVLTGPDDHFYGIDPWIDNLPAEKAARSNLAEYGAKATLYKDMAANILVGWEHHAACSLGAVYLDSKHRSPFVLAEFGLVWPLVQVGGVVIFDDYCKRLKSGVMDGVDGCVAAVQKSSEVLFNDDIQLALRKTIEYCPGRHPSAEHYYREWGKRSD